MSEVLRWMRGLFANNPCGCDACTGRQPNRSGSPYVSNGLHMWVGRDGNFHWRGKSRIVDP